MVYCCDAYWNAAHRPRVSEQRRVNSCRTNPTSQHISAHLGHVGSHGLLVDGLLPVELSESLLLVVSGLGLLLFVTDDKDMSTHASTPGKPAREQTDKNTTRTRA
ncbi:MAG: hypothetical protein ACPIOQ_02345 [Promethearchaeia archaeon]